MKEKCKPIENLPAARLPKKEWDWLFKEGYLNKKQISFLKKAESLGFNVDIRQLRHNQYNFKPYYSWSDYEVTISKRMINAKDQRGV